MNSISSTRSSFYRNISLPLLLIGAFFLSAFITSSAYAGESLAGEILVILASEQAGNIDPSLASIAALRKPPFSAFRSMRVMSRSPVSVSSGQPVTVSLPNGRLLSLQLEARLPDGRSKVRVSIKRPNEKDYLPLLEVIASPGEPFFVAGQKYQNETLVIGVTVGKKTS
jgi:hypothetical protein